MEAQIKDKWLRGMHGDNCKRQEGKGAPQCARHKIEPSHPSMRTNDHPALYLHNGQGLKLLQFSGRL